MPNGDNNLRRIGNFEIDLEKKILWVNDRPAELPVKAVEVLCALIETEGEVISKEELLTRVWRDAFVEDGVLTQNIYLLRKTFKQNGQSKDIIQTVPRRGYRFVGDRNFVTDVSEITIEREVVEQTIITTDDYSFANEPARTIHTDSENSTVSRSSPRTLLWGIAGIGAILGTILLFSSFSRDAGQSAVRSIRTDGVNITYERLTASGRAFYVGLSPDNTNAAYIVHTADNKYALSLYHLPTKSETVIIQPQELHIRNINFSPDANYIYYLAAQGTVRHRIYRIPIYGGSPQLITDDLTNHFTISPDGEWLAFYRMLPNANLIEICRSNDCSERRVVAKREGLEGFLVWGAAPAWSPDGTKFAAAAFTRQREGERGRLHLVEVDVGSGEQKLIAAPDWYDVHQPLWRPDGSGLYVMVRENQGEPVQLWQLDYPSGRARNLTNDDNDYREFRVASDESFLLASIWNKSENLFLASVDDPANVRQLTYDSTGSNGASALCWAKDGRSLIYSKTSARNVGHLWLMDTASIVARQLTRDDKVWPHYCDATPDGGSVVFGYNKTGVWHIWKVDLNGENLRQVTGGNYEAAPEVSPDGKWLYYISTRKNAVWKQPIEGGPPVEVLAAGSGTVRVSPSDPSKFVSYYNDEKETVQSPWKFVIFDEDYAGHYIDLEIPAGIFFEWSPDGSGIYYSDNGESFSNIWLVNAADKSRRQITAFTDQKIANFSISPDGSTFAISRGSATGNIIKLTPK